MYHFIKYLILYIKHRRVLNRIYKEEGFIDKLNEVFTFGDIKFNFKVDRRGSLYVLFNPLLLPREMFIFDGDQSLDTFINNFIMDRMMIISLLMRDNTMFELLTPFRIEKWDNNYNYLAITEPIVWGEFWKWTKVAIWEIVGMMLLGGGIFWYFF